MSATKKHIRLLLLLAAGLLVACSTDEPGQQVPETQDEICLNASVWQMMQGAPSRTMTEDAPLRASTYDAGTLTSGSFTAAAYEANTTTPYINPVQVNYITDKWVWSDGKHYWPASGNLDFFAYMPAAIPSYITDNSDEESLVSYVARNPQFKCKNLPMTYDSASPTAGQGSDLQEFVYALVTDQNKTTPGTSGVTLTFQHPFARIKLQLSASQPKDVTISTITLKTVQNNGTYTHSSGWTPTGATTDFVVTLNQDFIVTGAAQALGAPAYLMVPQAWTGTIELGATWKEWGKEKTETLSASVPTTWAPGYSYTYSFTISEYDLIVDIQKFTEQW